MTVPTHLLSITSRFHPHCHPNCESSIAFFITAVAFYLGLRLGFFRYQILNHAARVTDVFGFLILAFLLGCTLYTLLHLLCATFLIYVLACSSNPFLCLVRALCRQVNVELPKGLQFESACNMALNR